MSSSFDQELLDQFVAGTLPEDRVEEVLQLLDKNEDALIYVDALWEQQLDGDELAPDAEIPPEQQRRLERRFFNSLQRSELGGRAVRFGTAGFFSVVWAFLRPILASRQQQRRRGDDDNG